MGLGPGVGAPGGAYQQATQTTNVDTNEAPCVPKAKKRQAERSNQLSAESMMALARTGGPKKASPKDCACEHESLLEMKEMQYLSSYCQPGKALHGMKCSNEDCDNGIVDAGWPKSPVWGGQAFCCEEILTMQGGRYACTFLACIPCGNKMIEAIKAKGDEGGTNRRSRRNRK
jgi:hypothetical protein